ncbi:MAG TPA: ParB/RepB/Spo0J family partition protein [Hyphomicrobiales bacterium]|nr:ParB/RepB/Spo0J family partition protein [Hyphomicrobiales bacterium]
MTDEGPRRRLGRGLAALIGEVDTEVGAIDRARTQRRLPIEFLRPNPRNPRKSFGEEDLADLTRSIKERGVVQPILVRPATDGSDGYEIIAGERRWRAAQRAGLHEVPVYVQEVSDREALELAIIENVQRADLNPLEEAAGYEQLMAEFGYSQTELADVIGKSRSHIANTIRLTKLPEKVRGFIAEGKLTAGHARTLVTLPDPEAAAVRIVEAGLNVREAEALAQAEAKPAAKRKIDKDADTKALERRLSEVLGLRVEIAHKGKGGEVKIRYRTLEQLDDVCRRLEGN